MMKKLMLFLAFAPCYVFSQNYDVRLIPESLIKNAEAVKRFEELRVIIKSPSKAIIKRKYVFTIFNEEGREFSAYVNTYDNLHKINDINGKLYDASGKELRSVKKKDISDVSYDDDMSLMTDDRMKRHNFYCNSYPYTVAYETEEEYDGIIGLPRWSPLEAEKLSVQQSRFIVEVPVDYVLRYRQTNNVNKPVITNSSKVVSYQWEVNNISPVKGEIFQPGWDDIMPSVVIAPTKFEYGGYEGDMSTWLGLGKYISALYLGRDALPENVKADIHKLIDDVPDKSEKVKLLYNYLQKNTRYISIQLGIGGFQPFPAKEVAAKKYGDCKALSNYMVSILKEAGIRANPVIVTAGEGRRGLWEDFPANYFNHVIACVPDGKDTMWLECTAQTESAGYMGSFTGDRKALLLAEDGGHVVSTPYYSKNQNLQIRKINGVINTEGNLLVEVSTHFTGRQQEKTHGLLYQATAKQREEYLNAAINLATYKVDRSEYKEQKGRIPAMDEYLKITVPNYASVTGQRMFIMPNIFNKSVVKLPTDEPRKFDIKLSYPYRDVDTIHLTIPPGYQVESAPKNVSFNTPFGNYSISYKIDDNNIDVLRVCEGNEGAFPAADYSILAKYYDDVYKADRAKFVLVRKNPN